MNEITADRTTPHDDSAVLNLSWVIVDTRTGKAAGMAAYLSESQALRQIEEFRERDRRGGRPDISDLMPFLEPRIAVGGHIFEPTGFDPAASDISFIRASRIVHVSVPVTPREPVVGTGIVEALLASGVTTATLCGRILDHNRASHPAAFDDDDLCANCYAVMGEHSYRLFEHDV